ncbi:serine/threonine-protein phosphatase [Arachnia propionica]|uniref:Serine/threonine-protein phosphatase n=1 Tax=Arachnia propionica TaxID=1750 RepID=A0A3P1T3B0_9ACTN|nr:protein phosphatase 2C domain-containing protein [Arachnia propionica]MDO5082418.1 protein phosphatase 2C domain-containing protein [Arachnia propionica]RRD04007.1 serine/threonine-protein phosphatase [Arachnia propionica]
MRAPSMVVRCAAATHQGLVRSVNEDSWLTLPPIFLVADGMGGHEAGELASRSVVDVFRELATHEWVGSDDLITTINHAAAEVSQLRSHGRAPGSTVSGVALSRQGGQPCWLVFNIGDSRTHLLRDGVFTQVSVDHSAAAQFVDAPRNIITRALGAGIEHPEADQWLIPALPGDLIVICSDGLSNELSPQVIAATADHTDDLQEAANRLVQFALDAGGRDNVTVVLVRCEFTEAVEGVTMDEDTLPPQLGDTIEDWEER